MSADHDDGHPGRVREAVQVYLGQDEQERLKRLTEQFDSSKSDVLRRGLEALERELLDPETPSGACDRRHGDHRRSSTHSGRGPGARPRVLGHRGAIMAGRKAKALNAVCVDTSAWFPLVDAGHVDHASLSAILRARVMKGTRIVTTNIVVAETHALLMRRIGIGVARGFASTVRLPPNLIVYATAERESGAISGWMKTYTR